MRTTIEDYVDRASMDSKDVLTMSWAVSLAEGNLGRGMKWAALENLSTVRMMVLPSDGGSPVTKSREIWDQGQ